MSQRIGRRAAAAHEVIRQVEMADGTITGLSNRVTVTQGSPLVADRTLAVTDCVFEVRQGAEDIAQPGKIALGLKDLAALHQQGVSLAVATKADQGCVVVVSSPGHLQGRCAAGLFGSDDLGIEAQSLLPSPQSQGSRTPGVQKALTDIPGINGLILGADRRQCVHRGPEGLELGQHLVIPAEVAGVGAFAPRRGAATRDRAPPGVWPLFSFRRGRAPPRPGQCLEAG